MLQLEAESAEKILKAYQTQLKQLAAQNKLRAYSPYAKQIEFHDAGKTFDQRLLLAANQVGKSVSGSAEVAIHLTGQYPSWWKGRVFEKPIKAWCAGVTSESTRDAPQLLLMGEALNHGTGFIPKSAIKNVAMRRGVADAVDNVVIRHGGGGDVQAGESMLGFKSYDQGREKFQGATLDLVWLDEEPDASIYDESLTRTNATSGMVMLTFTPLKGMSSVVKRYLTDKLPGTHVTSMTIDDAEHYTPEQRATIIARYLPHERDARVKGIPAMGSGKVFLIDESQVVINPIPIPAHWPRILGIDFGWDHPTAVVEMAWDKDADIVYITKEYRQREVVPAIVADAVKGWGGWQPIAWPHDGLQHDKGSGEQLATQYRNKGLLMLRERATFEDGTNGVEAGIGDMLERMMTGKFKVFSTCQMYLAEMRMYHRKNGLINKTDDDLISASRYAYMMRRKAKVRMTTQPTYGQLNAGDSYTGY